MYIEELAKTECLLSEVEPGQVFTFNGRVYIKMQTRLNRFDDNAVNLKTGASAFLDNTCNVCLYVHAKLTLEPSKV